MTDQTQPASQSNTTAFVVRPARPEDAAAIKQIARETWAATYEGLIFPEIQDNFVNGDYSPEELRKSIRGEGVDYWFRVAETTGDNPRIIGFAEVHKRAALAPDAELSRIYMLPAWQRKGIGNALFENLLVTIRALRPDLRPPRLKLTVATENKQAIRFYEQRGFRFDKDFEASLPGQKLALQDYVLEI